MKKTALVSFTIVGLVAAGFTAFYPKSVKSEDIAPKLVEIDQNSPNPAKPAWDKPLISPTTDITLNRPQSIVYCPTITVAWQELRKSFELPEPTDFTNKLDKDALSFKRSSLPDNAYAAFSGSVGSGIIDKINSVHRKFFNKTMNFGPVNRGDVIQYCALKHEIEYPVKFEKFDASRRTIIFNDITESKLKNGLSFFGSFSNSYEFTHSVDVLSFEDKAFSLRLLSKESEYAIVLSTFESIPSTLNESIEETRQRIQRWEAQNIRSNDINGFSSLEDYLNRYTPAALRDHDTIIIPFLTLNQYIDFEELIGLPLSKNGQITSHKIKQAKQHVGFNLTQAGSKVESFAYIQCVDLGMPYPQTAEPRHFHFDRPFLCTMWKDGETMPYLAVWVNGPDVLEKSSN